MGIFATFRGTSAPEELPLWAPSGQVALPLRNRVSCLVVAAWESGLRFQPPWVPSCEGGSRRRFSAQ